MNGSIVSDGPRQDPWEGPPTPPASQGSVVLERALPEGPTTPAVLGVVTQLSSAWQARGQFRARRFGTNTCSAIHKLLGLTLIHRNQWPISRGSRASKQSNKCLIIALPYVKMNVWIHHPLLKVDPQH